ncbi:MAG: cytochrome [Tardiphaga sp.]|nr:cytochrome [Tardiphaga sp.]
MLRNTTAYWGSLSRALHWGLGVAIIFMLAYGWWFNHLAPRPVRFFHRSIHADIGYLILLLMALRLIWRALNPVPALPAGSPRWERVLASAGHWALYVVTMVVALLGWAHSGAHKPDYASFFGWFRVPQFTSTDKAMADLYEDLHIYAAYLLIALVVIHIAAAAYHRFIKRDNVMARMVTGQS